MPSASAPSHLKDSVLELLGTVGLIFIVLEAALELELRKDKLTLILRSATLALAALALSTGAIAAFLHFALAMPWFQRGGLRHSLVHHEQRHHHP